MTGFKTEQELFWAGEFGANYIKRKIGSDLLESYNSCRCLISDRQRSHHALPHFG
jgi:hypothetical protein